MADPTLNATVLGADLPILDLNKAPLPTKKTLKMRKNVPIQLVKFLGFDTRIMMMVIKGHLDAHKQKG